MRNMDNDGLQKPLDLRTDTEELEYIHANFDNSYTPKLKKFATSPIAVSNTCRNH